MDLSVIVTYPNGTIETFSDLKSVSEKTGLSESAIKIRCNKSRNGSASKADKIHCKWVNDTTFRSYQARKNKVKGSNWEYELRDMFKAIGYDDCVTSRGESKSMDNNKIDLISESLPCYIQAKNLQNTPSYFNIEQECTLKDKPFCICWKKSDEINKAIAMIPMNFFIELLKAYHELH